jgi:hypothetical protein
MNSGRVRVFLVLGLATFLCLAASPLAMVRSSSPFVLDGTMVPVAGMSSYPITAGDEIVAGTAPAVITFADGSRVVLEKNSKARIESEGKNTVLRLAAGSGTYRLSSGSRLRLFEADKPAGALLVNEAGADSLAVKKSQPQVEAIKPNPVSRN